MTDSHGSSEISDDYDVTVIGAGPAGSTVAALTAEYGHRTLLLERSIFPRFHVGESLIPETYWPLKRLGLIEELKKSAFPKKFSVQFVNEDGKESKPFYFDEHKPHESSQTWQVWRDQFDQMLVDCAVRRGAEFRTNAQVLDVLFEKDLATGVRVKLGTVDDQSSREIRSRVVVDASGQSAFLANRLGLKTTDSHLRKGSIWGYFKGALRDSGRDEGATVILQTGGKKSWFWYIPLPDDHVSVGCTGGMEYMFGERESAGEIFERELARCPGMQRRLANAKLTHGFLTTKDFSYRASQVAGPGWVLIGDAFGFIDPVYSTGVFLALKSGEFAADAIHAAFECNDFSTKQLGCWQEQYVGGLELFRKLVYAFYTPDFSFGQFLRKHPQYVSNLVDMLIGDVFRPGVGEMFEVMGEVAPPAD